MKYSRVLRLNGLLKQKSHFLFGPRTTGKSWLIQHQLQGLPLFDLLDSDVYSRLLRRPKQLGEELGDAPVAVIDEIQKLPILLDEVHRLIEKSGKRFLLTGSSARKLRRSGTNLLAGRARSLFLYPLVSREIPNFDLQRYVNYGGLPSIYNSENSWEELKDYVDLYLREEIQAEALIRRIDHFVHFMDVIGLASGQELNIAKIANDSGVPPRTVASFLEVLTDTLLAFPLLSYQKTKKRKAQSKSKIYLFDVGVGNYLAQRRDILPKSEAFGDAFEHFIVQEVRAILGYRRLSLPLYYWRSNDFEVDLIIGDKMAIEIKSSEQLSDRHMKGILKLKEEKLIKEYYLVSRDPVERKVDGINLINYVTFLKKLWVKKL